MLRKEHSFLYSNQRDEPTCAYHVFSKILLKNRIELFYPLPIVSPLYNTNKCNRYLDTQDIQLETLTPEECTPNGFLKIILFHYFYSLYDTYLNRHGKDKKTFSLDDIDVIDVEINHAIIPKDMPHKKEIMDKLRIINHVKQSLSLRYHKIIVFNKVGILDIIRKILSLRFYIGLVLQDDMSDEEHAHHAVTIIAIDEDEGEIIFKNSWGDERVYNMRVDDLKFKLGRYTFEMEYFLFYLPCTSAPPLEIVNSLETMDVFSRWVDDYVRQFPEMMSRVPELLATMPEPAEASEPPLTRFETPTFKVGDVVMAKGESKPVTITEIKNGNYYFEYLDEYGDKKEKSVRNYEMTKVGGESRRRTRKRIR